MNKDVKPFKEAIATQAICWPEYCPYFHLPDDTELCDNKWCQWAYLKYLKEHGVYDYGL